MATEKSVYDQISLHAHMAEMKLKWTQNVFSYASRDSQIWLKQSVSLLS